MQESKEEIRRLRVEWNGGRRGRQGGGGRVLPEEGKERLEEVGGGGRVGVEEEECSEVDCRVFQDCRVRAPSAFGAELLQRDSLQTTPFSAPPLTYSRAK